MSAAISSSGYNETANNCTIDNQTCNVHRKYYGFVLSTEASIVLYSLIFLLAAIGNTLVIVTLVQNKRMRTVTNVFLINLASSDLLLAVICMPFTLVAHLFRNFMLGLGMCVLIRYLQNVSVAVNCFTLLSISVERYYAICQPFRSRKWQTLRHAYTVIAITWLSALVVTIPVAASQQLVPLRNGKHACREVITVYPLLLAHTFFLNTILLVLPITVMSVTYFLIYRKLWYDDDTNSLSNANEVSNGRLSDTEQLKKSKISYKRSGFSNQVQSKVSDLDIRVSNQERALANKRKVVKMLLVVVLEYFICWTPISVVTTWIAIDYVSISSRLTPMVKSLLHLLSYTSSCCNPITYCFMNKTFRNGFLTAFRCFRKPANFRHDRHAQRPIKSKPSQEHYALCAR